MVSRRQSHFAHTAARLSRRAHLFALCFPLLCASCTETACFEWSSHEGACPAQEAALTFFQDTSCHYSEIKTVESEPYLENEACCYEVTKWSPDEERVITCE